MALFVVRSGLVEITRRRANGEELLLAVLEPPASFEELAAMGCDVVRWSSARARGPVAVVALGRPDLDVAVPYDAGAREQAPEEAGRNHRERLQLLVEAQFLDQHDKEPNDGGEKQPSQRG